jgi:hypothetical protein
MLELDEAHRRALSQRYGPTPDAQARVLAGLRATLGGPLGPEPGGGGEGVPPSGAPPPDTGQLVWIAKICAATAGLTGAGLLVLKLGASVLIDDADERAPAAVPDRVSLPAPTHEPTAPLDDAKPPQTDSEAPSSVAPSTVVPIQSPTKRRATGTASTLAAELALLDGAERIRSADPEAALMRLDQHRKEFPTGALAPERERMRAEVLCALGRAPKASCSGTASNKTGD